MNEGTGETTAIGIKGHMLICVSSLFKLQNDIRLMWIQIYERKLLHLIAQLNKVVPMVSRDLSSTQREA